MEKIALASLAVAALVAGPASATLTFGAATLTVGTTAYVLSGTQVTLAVAAIAGLAIVKEALILSHLADSRRRGKRQVDAIDFTSAFWAIYAQDTEHCGKLLVCHAFATEGAEQTSEEKAIMTLFDDLSLIQHNAFGKYQWAAYTGTFKNPAICEQRYSTCKVDVDTLTNLVKVE